MSAPIPMTSFAEETSCGGGDCQITLTCNNKRFIVLLSRQPSPSSSNTPDSIECAHLEKLDRALESDDPRKSTAIIDEISGFLAPLCQPIFREFASLTGNEPEFLDLESCINPETFKLQLVTVDGKPNIVRRDGNGSGSTIPSKFCSPDVRTIVADLQVPIFPSKEVKLLQRYRGRSIMKVSARGQVLCCKTADAQTHEAVDREFRCLQQISIAALDPPLRVPKLCGVVESGDDTFWGILMTNISWHPENPVLGMVDIDTVTLPRRKKWASQIGDTVERLHDAGVVWGDAKADNILIDGNDDAWVTDFGGGWTENWVDEELADSVEGDQQGLKCILDFLGL